MRPARPAKTAGKNAKAPAPPVLPDVFAKDCEPERLLSSGDALWALPADIDPQQLHGLRVLRTGLLLRPCGRQAHGAGSRAGNGLCVREEAARCASLTQEQALAYQAGETLELGDLPAGYTLLCCEGVSLGWGKQAGGT